MFKEITLALILVITSAVIHELVHYEQVRQQGHTTNQICLLGFDKENQAYAWVNYYYGNSLSRISEMPAFTIQITYIVLFMLLYYRNQNK